MVAQPYQFFQHIWKEFIQRGQGRLLLAIHQNKIIAATIFLLWQDTVYYKFNASIPEDLTVNPNDPQTHMLVLKLDWVVQPPLQYIVKT